MGEPIRIVNLARDLIRLSGYRPDEEIKIVFSGMRPGEKLYEEINLSEENATKTRHPRIWIGRSAVTDLARVGALVDRLLKVAQRADPAALRRDLRSVVPEYTPTLGDRAEAVANRPERPAGRESVPESARRNILPNSA